MTLGGKMEAENICQSWIDGHVKGLSPNKLIRIEKIGLQNTHFLVNSLNQNYGQNIYFYSNKNHLGSILLTQNTFAIIQSDLEPSLQKATEMEKEKLGWGTRWVTTVTEDPGFCRCWGPELCTCSAKADWACSFAAWIITWQ